MVSSVSSQSNTLTKVAFSGSGIKQPLIKPMAPDDSSLSNYQDKVHITGVSEKSPVYEPNVGGGTTQPDPKIQKAE